MEESVSLKATVLRSHVSSAEKQIHCLSYRNVVWSLTSNNVTPRSTRTKRLSLPFTGRSPQDLKESPPVVENPSPVCAFLDRKWNRNLASACPAVLNQSRSPQEVSHENGDRLRRRERRNQGLGEDERGKRWVSFYIDKLSHCRLVT
ncbi:hypothetical protein VN97_g7201 [Penicillium thymicola]|uniref:Uncharacterized protein n=1 Tax=Penicillium thymicola TaxID=293382 RepID=A0AAI9TF73_PENTH|nr:hypothetical protein VN97_g7201 [Penicillium thymicola]